MENPLNYFDNLLNKTQEQVKGEYMNNMHTSVSVESEDYDKGMIKYYSMVYDINTDSGIEALHTFKFSDTLYNDIKKESSKSLELIKNDILEITKGGNSPQHYIKELEQRLDKLKFLAKKNFLDYPKLEETIEKLKLGINNKLLDSPLIEIENTYSFDLDYFHINDKINAVERLYTLLTTSPPIISADKQDFINAFTKKEITNGIKWLLKTRNGHTSKSSIFYFINELRKEKFLIHFDDSTFGKRVEYIFRDYNGKPLQNIKQSLQDFRNKETCDDEDRINDIISQMP